MLCWVYQLARSNRTFQEDWTASNQQEFWQRSDCCVIHWTGCWFKLEAAVCCWQLNKNPPREAQWLTKTLKIGFVSQISDLLVIWGFILSITEPKFLLDHFYWNATLLSYKLAHNCFHILSHWLILQNNIPESVISGII